MQAMQEIWVRSINWEDPLKQEMATHSSILAWKIPWTEEPGGQQGLKELDVQLSTGHSAYQEALPKGKPSYLSKTCFYVYIQQE